MAACARLVILVKAAECGPLISELKRTIPPLLPLGVVAELGENNSEEGLDHGFNIVLVLSAANLALLRPVLPACVKTISVCGSGMGQYGLVTSSMMFVGIPTEEACLPVREIGLFAGGAGIRHLVAWRFKPQASKEAISAAVDGYRALPRELPYFMHLETGAVEKGSKYSCALFSTFRGPVEQKQFVEDPRRKSFKARFVQPYLDDHGVLVLDYIPEQLGVRATL